MKLTTILCFLLLLGFTSPAQVNTDSLHAIMNSGRSYEDRVQASIKLMSDMQTKDFDSTIIIGDLTIKLARKNHDSIRVAEAKHMIGVASYFKGDYDVAAKNYFESINILEKNRAQQKLAPVYNDLAKLFRKTRDLDRAEENYNKAEAIYRKLKDTSGISMILNESGVVYEYKSDYKQALARYTASLNMAAASGDSLGVSYALSNIAGVNVIEKKYGEAERNLLRALVIRQQLKDSFAIALTYSDLGAAMNDKGDFEKALDYLQISNTMAERLHYPELQSNNYTELAEVSQKQGNYQKAFDYFMKRSYLRDSLYALEKAKQIEEIQMQYETEQKEEQIQQQRERLRLQNYIFIGIGGLILLLGLLVHSWIRRTKLRQETRLQSQLIAQQEMAVKAVLEAEENERQRIARELHDGVGQMMSAAKMNLSAFESNMNFRDEEQKQSLEKIMDLVDESCREVRTVSHIMMPNALLKNNLANAIKEFVDKINNKQLQVHVYTEGLEERMDSNIETVLYRVIQECVNNAIKHAGATMLDISLIKDAKEISGAIEDNGKGFDTATQFYTEGIGIRNIRSRIEYLKGKVDFDSAPGRGTVITFHVPVN